MKYNAAELEKSIARNLKVTKAAFRKAFPSLQRIRKSYPKRSKEDLDDHRADITSLLEKYK